MKLRDRYRKLTIWNKVSFWGSLCSILGIIIFCITQLFPLANPVVVLPASFEYQPSYQIDSEAERLLAFIYQLQTKYDLHKIVIGRNGRITGIVNGITDDLNIVEMFFEISDVNERHELAFEKLLMKIPETLLRHIPESRYDNPFVVSVTEQGKEHLRN